MIVKDLFSHKIHSSTDSWSAKLIDLAFIFYEFDRTPYDRELLEKRLSEISPRASSVARDPSKFRDEISAYPAYLGLYRVEKIDGIWHFILSDTAKKFLVTEEPNVPAFMLLQMVLFQYPNGMGVAYSSNSNGVRIQANTRDRTLEFIRHGVHLSPLRLICKALEADAAISSSSVFDAAVSYKEIFALANDPRIYQKTCPDLETVCEVINAVRTGEISPPATFESRFHILKHTDFLVPGKSSVQLRSPINQDDRQELEGKFKVINSLTVSFDEFDTASSSDEVLEQVISGAWGRYFDGVRTLNSETVEILSNEKGLFIETPTEKIEPVIQPPSPIASRIYDFRKRNPNENTYTTYSLPQSRIDPELTRIKRQRSNLTHKVVLQQLEEYLEHLGCNPVENDHIDLFAQIPGDGKFIFEVKSSTRDNLLSQARKGISQLYEYRYRYQNMVGYDVFLCLVFPERPDGIDWLESYICTDRQIGIIWFNQKGIIEYSPQGEYIIKSLLR